MNSPFSLLRTRPSEGLEKPASELPALLCFSHLRWDCVHKRPKHLLNEAAATYRVFFFEEPEFAEGMPHFRMQIAASGVAILTPVFDQTADPAREQQVLVAALQSCLGNVPVVHWFHTPMALRYARGLPYDLCVYDRMDELPAFGFAPAELVALETELLSRADLVLTAGQHQPAPKRRLYGDVHFFPSSVEIAYLAQARAALAEPQDQIAGEDRRQRFAAGGQHPLSGPQVL